MAQTPPNGRQPSLDQNRQEALTRVMALQDSRDSQPRVGLGDGGDPRLMALDYALHLLGDSRPLVSADGTLTDLLEANGFTYREVRTPTDLLRSSRTVLLLLRQSDGSPMVVHSRGGRSQLYDPLQPEGPQPLQHEPACKPYAYELYSSWPSGVRAWPQLLVFSLKGHLMPLVAVLVSALVVALFNLSIPTLTSFLASTVLPLGQARLIVETSLVVLLVAVATTVAQLFSSLALVRLESLVNLRVESALWTHLLRLPLAFFSRLGTADLIQRVAAVGEMRQLLSNGLLSSALGLLFSLTNLILMINYQAQLALVAGCFSALSALAMALLVWQNAKLEAPLQEGQAEVNNLGLQAVIGMAQIRVGGNEPFVFERWFRDVARLAFLQRRGEAVANALEILSRVLNPIGQAIIFGVFMVLLNQSRQASITGVAVAPGGLSSILGANQLVASFVSFQAAYISFNSQLASLATQMASTVAELVVLWQRSEVIMYAQMEPGTDYSHQQHKVQGVFTIQGLKVRYQGSDETILKDINLTVAKGTYTAITGASGCGKTTLLRCLLRLMEPDAGVISVDGIDLRKLAVRAYRRQLGVVLQNTPLPSGSIYDIVRAGRPYSREEVWEALAQASIADDVLDMAMQLETVINDGAGSISGGQRQRIALARALLGEPRVLLLDEATSALDAPTQASITRTLEELPITRIAIAHRLSTIESADQIAVIQNGVVAELGTYRELCANKEGYLANRVIFQ
jgi:ABC-type bacteriocin/lantibiotic exporter with double-glycine peptidase domain